VIPGTSGFYGNWVKAPLKLRPYGALKICLLLLLLLLLLIIIIIIIKDVRVGQFIV